MNHTLVPMSDYGKLTKLSLLADLSVTFSGRLVGLCLVFPFEMLNLPKVLFYLESKV